MNRAFKIIINGLLVAVCTVTFGWALVTGLDKELDRQEAVQRDNCAKYGQHINRMAGSEVCPPTPHG
ncbi:MAG: hypothetical protein ACPGQQ_02910 [Candidatus Puniceispirillaceae bacterium]